MLTLMARDHNRQAEFTMDYTMMLVLTVNSSNLMCVLLLHHCLIDVNFYYFMEVLSIDYNLKKVDLFLFEEQKPQCLECY